MRCDEPGCLLSEPAGGLREGRKKEKRCWGQAKHLGKNSQPQMWPAQSNSKYHHCFCTSPADLPNGGARGFISCKKKRGCPEQRPGWERRCPPQDRQILAAPCGARRLLRLPELRGERGRDAPLVPASRCATANWGEILYQDRSLRLASSLRQAAPQQSKVSRDRSAPPSEGPDATEQSGRGRDTFLSTARGDHCILATPGEPPPTQQFLPTGAPL